MISWKSGETSSCEAHAARRYHLSSSRPQSAYQSCAMLWLLRGHTVSGVLDYKLRKAVLHSGHLWAAPIMAEPGSRIHGQPEYSCWHFWTGAAGRWELLSERGMLPPPSIWGKPVTFIRRQSGPWISGGEVAESPGRRPSLVDSVTCSSACKALNSCSCERAQGRVRFTSGPAEQLLRFRAAVRQHCGGRMVAWNWESMPLRCP